MRLRITANITGLHYRGWRARRKFLNVFGEERVSQLEDVLGYYTNRAYAEIGHYILIEALLSFLSRTSLVIRRAGVIILLVGIVLLLSMSKAVEAFGFWTTITGIVVIFLAFFLLVARSLFVQFGDALKYRAHWPKKIAVELVKWEDACRADGGYEFTCKYAFGTACIVVIDVDKKVSDSRV